MDVTPQKLTTEHFYIVVTELDLVMLQWIKHLPDDMPFRQPRFITTYSTMRSGKMLPFWRHSAKISAVFVGYCAASASVPDLLLVHDASIQHRPAGPCCLGSSGELWAAAHFSCLLGPPQNYAAACQWDSDHPVWSCGG